LQADKATTVTNMLNITLHKPTYGLEVIFYNEMRYINLRFTLLYSMYFSRVPGGETAAILAPVS